MLPARFEATRPGSIALLTLMVALGQMSMGLYQPSMPSMVDALDTSVGQIQLTLTVFIAGFAVSQLIWGPIADRFGRRPALLAGISIFACAGAACAVAQSVEQLILFRFIQALGACSGQVVARAVVRDSTEGAGTARVMSYIAMAMSLSPAITPSIGGQLQAMFGWRANFVLLALIGFALVVLSAVRLPETNRWPVADALSPWPMLRNYASLLRDRSYLGYVLTVGGVFGALVAYQTGAPFVLMGELGWSPRAYGLLILVTVLGFLCGGVTATRISERLGTRRMVAGGALVILVSGVSMLVPALVGHLSTAALLAPMTLFSFGMGIGLPNAFAGALQGFPRIAGSASALMGFCQMGIAASGSLAVSWIGGDAHLTLSAVFCGFAGAGFLAFVVLVPPDDGAGSQDESPRIS